MFCNCLPFTKKVSMLGDMYWYITSLKMLVYIGHKGREHVLVHQYSQNLKFLLNDNYHHFYHQNSDFHSWSISFLSVFTLQLRKITEVEHENWVNFVSTDPGVLFRKKLTIVIVSGEFFSLSYFAHTVKLVYKDPSRGPRKTVFIKRWSLYRGLFVHKWYYWGQLKTVFMTRWSLYTGGR